MEQILKNWQTTIAGVASFTAAVFDILQQGANGFPNGISHADLIGLATGVGLILARDAKAPVAEVAKRTGALALPFLAAASLLAFGAVRASAADLASPSLFANGYTGSGFYIGIDSQGAAGSVNGAPVGTTVTQGELGAVLGYSFALGPSTFAFVEGDFNWTNVNGSTTGFSFTGPAHFEQRFALGGPITQLLNFFPGINLPQVPTLPVLPQGVTAGPSNPYVFVGLHEEDISALYNEGTAKAWLFAPGIGLGMLTTLSNHVALDVFAEYQLNSDALCVGAVCTNLGQAVRVGLAAKY